MSDAATVHASAVLAANRGVLVRGPAGSGKSRLVLALLDCLHSSQLRFARLIADDRVQLAASHGRLLMRPAPALAGLIEVRGLGIRKLAWEPVAVASLVVDLAAADASRMPPRDLTVAEINGVRLPRLPVAADADALAAVLVALHTMPTKPD
jgi:serine kinase of HPr protein (carbohydrate metabolism regulator)